MTQSRWVPVSSQEHQRQTVQPCRRTCFPFTHRTPFSLSEAWCIQARADLRNDWSKEKKITLTALLSISDMKDQTFKALFFYSCFKGTDVLFKDTAVSAGMIQSGKNKTLPKSKQCWLIEWRTTTGRQKVVRVARGGARKEDNADWLAISWGASVCLQGKVTEGNGSNEVWREGTVLGCLRDVLMRHKCRHHRLAGSLYYTFPGWPANTTGIICFPHSPVCFSNPIILLALSKENLSPCCDNVKYAVSVCCHAATVKGYDCSGKAILA